MNQPAPVALLIDVTRCVGCYHCVDACTQANNLGPHLPAPQDSPDGLSARRWSTLVAGPANRYIRKQCRHCLEPACAAACPVGAMRKTDQGPVIYDSSKCLGCRYCMMACPYGIPRYTWDSLAPVVSKCTLCYNRLQTGQLPACAEACPEQAVMFGPRANLLAQAHHQLKTEPHRYLPQVFGEFEAGGSAVLYLSDVPLEVLLTNGSQPGNEPLPALTEAVMSKVPPIALGVAAVMTGIHWIIERRMRQMNQKSNLAEQSHDSTPPTNHR